MPTWRWFPVLCPGLPLQRVGYVSLLLLLAGCNGDSKQTPDTPGADDDQPAFNIQLTDDLPSSTSGESASGTVASEVPNIVFSESQSELGIQHVYENGAAGRSLLVETIGGGCGWIDFDNDGDVDLYLNQGGDATATAEELESGNPPLDAMFWSRDGANFVNVAAPARIIEPFYSQGVGVADYNNDGFDDVYVSNYGRNTLWKNLGDGTFEEVAAFARVDDLAWSASVAWSDLDRDGDLDLYVCNYCDYDAQNPVECKDRMGRDTLCNPADISPAADTCFFNNGDGSFSEEAAKRGLLGDGNRALGVAIADFDADGWPDIYVANDTTDNFLFMNLGGESVAFADEARLRGCAVDRVGGPQGSMGVAVADYDQNGTPDIYCTHFYEESNTLYANFGEQGFRDVTAIAGLHQPTLNLLGFGAVFSDFDSSGTLELFVANGHVDNSPRLGADPEMVSQLFSYASGNRWRDISTQTGDYFKKKYLGRGVATADFDRDGDIDLAIANENAEAVVLENESPQQGWLSLRLIGTVSNRSAIGANVVVETATSKFVRQLCGGTSFAAAHESKLHFGLGTISNDDIQVSIVWASGREQQIQVGWNQEITIIED